jgi:hypothetical protein
VAGKCDKNCDECTTYHGVSLKAVVDNVPKLPAPSFSMDLEEQVPSHLPTLV